MRKKAIAAMTAACFGMPTLADAATTFTPVIQDAIVLENNSSYQMQGNKLIDVFFDVTVQCTSDVYQIFFALPKAPVAWYGKAALLNSQPAVSDFNGDLVANTLITRPNDRYTLHTEFSSPNKVKISHSQYFCYVGDQYKIMMHFRYLAK